MKKSVSNNIFYNMLFQFFVTFLPIITTPYLSRTMGVTQSGVYSFIESIVTLIITFGGVGTFLYGCRKIAYVRDNKDELSKVTWEIIGLKLFLTFVVLLIYIPCLCIFGKFNNYFIIFIISIVASGLEVTWFFNGIEDFKSVTIKNFVVKIIFVLSLFLFIHNPDDLWIYMLLVCLNSLLGNIVMWFNLKKYITPFKDNKNLKIFHHLKESVILFIPQSANYIYSLADRSMLGMLSKTMYNVGIYDYAQRILRMIIGILQSIGFVILTRISNLSSKNDMNGVKDYIYKSIRLTLLLGFPMMFGLITIVNRFVPLYLGEDFSGVITVLYIMCPLIVITSINSALGVQLLLAIKRDKSYIKSSVTGAVINIILNFIMIPYWGILGACVASLISEIIVFIMQFYFTNDIISFVKVIRQNYKYFLLSLIMMIVSILLNLLNINDIIILLMQISISVIIYFGILLIIKDEFIIKISKIVVNIFSRKKV